MKINKFNYVYRKRKIFEKVDFYFEDGSINFILGANNSGKTTILNGIIQNNFPSFPKSNEIGYFSQENKFQVGLTVKEIILFVRGLNQGINSNLPFIIEEIRDFRFSDLTLSESKLVLIYLSTIVDKKLYLFDEPEIDLNLDMSKIIFDWFRNLSKSGKTVIVATNKLDNICDMDNVNYIKNSQEIIVNNYLKIKSRMAF